MNRIQKMVITMLFATAGCKGTNKNVPVSSIESSISIDKIQLKDLDGHAIYLNKYKGKTIFINFWATWCKPCIDEMPSIEKAQEVLQDKEVVFLFASSENIEEINSFRNVHNYKLNYARIENSEEINIQGLPTTFIFDPKGRLVFDEIGSRKWNEKSNIEMILKIANKNE